MTDIIFFLHMHLPYMKHPKAAGERQNFQEVWFYEAVLETYLPLLMCLEKLTHKHEKERIRLCLNASPTVLEMLQNDYHRKGFQEYLQRMMRCAQNELERTRDTDTYFASLKMEPDQEEKERVLGAFDRIQRTARYHWQRVYNVSNYYQRIEEGYNPVCGIAGRLREWQEEGVVEMVAQPATHPLSPMLGNQQLVDLQLKVGIAAYRRAFGVSPRGVWLPEKAFFTPLKGILSNNGIEYTFLEPIALLGYDWKRTSYFAWEEMGFFLRDIIHTELVWNKKTGYPSGANYQEFYRDAGWDLSFDVVGSSLGDNSRDYEGETRHPLGFKYHRLTGDVELGKKDYYERYGGIRQALKDARHFVHSFNNEEKQALSFLAFDCELFGHWWRDGVEWLYFVLNMIASSDTLRLTLPGDVHDRLYEEATHVRPKFSSWGQDGYLDYWCNDGNRDFWFLVDEAHGYIPEVLKKAKETESATIQRACEQYLREVLLLHASDFPFIITNHGAATYSRRRFEKHHQRCLLLYKQIQEGSIDVWWLDRIFEEDDVFCCFDLLDIYCKTDEPRAGLLNLY